jgi:hypothetical protein
MLRDVARCFNLIFDGDEDLDLNVALLSKLLRSLWPHVVLSSKMAFTSLSNITQYGPSWQFYKCYGSANVPSNSGGVGYVIVLAGAVS